MKRIISIFVLIVSLLTFTAFAEENQPTQKPIDVIVNGEALVMDVEPVIVNDRTMVPMRAIFEALGARVTWVAESRIIVAICDDTMVVMQIDNNSMTVEKTGEEKKNVIELDAAPYILNDRTLVPVRAVSEALAADVKWDAKTRTVTIINGEGSN